MGESFNTQSNQATSAVMEDYQRYLPGLIRQLSAETPNTATQALAAANAQVNPTDPKLMGYNALNLDQLQKYALPQARVGQEVARSNALAGADTNLAQLSGSGGDAARAARRLNEELNPEYYTAQGAASKGAADAINAINLKGLSPGEYNATERALNQGNNKTGNLGLNNPMNVISNAMNFGGAYNNKIALLNNAVAAATGASNSAASGGGFNPINIALSQPNASTGTNFGAGQFTNTNAGTTQGAQGNAFNFGQGLLGSLSSISNANTSAGASMGAANSPASYLGAVCCFIFLEAYKGLLPKCVRKGRDKYYYVNHDIATGYRRMAKWLVPLMKKYGLIRWLTWKLIVKPITIHLSHPKQNLNKRIAHFWLRSWAILGKGKNENSYSMKWEYPSYV